MKRIKRLLLVLTLNIVWGSCWVSSANAGVITMGTWTAMNTSNAAFWNNSSWDGPGQNVGQLLTLWGAPFDYLSLSGAPVAFAFDQTEFFWEVSSNTAWMDGRSIVQQPNGSITFTTHGYTYNTLITPQQFSLFRYTGSVSTVYFLGVEDIPGMWGDRDYNDYIGYTIEFLPPPPPPTNPTPEPGTLALLLSGGGLALWRKKRTSERTSER